MAKRFSSEQKSALLKEIRTLQDGGLSVKDACKKAKISLPTFYNWKNGTAASASGRDKRAAKAGQDLGFGNGDGILICGSASFVQQIAGTLGLRR